MADIFSINNVFLCTSSSTVNTVTLANIDNVDAVDKSCDTAPCWTCGPIYMSSNDSCPLACEDDSCASYYFVLGADACNCDLQVGVQVYKDTICTPADAGYYSPNKCANKTNCPWCYQIDASGIIIAKTNCEGSCVAIQTSVDAVSSCREGGSAGSVCQDEICTTRYTTGTPGSLVPGDFLYSDSGCLCSPLPTPQGFYRAWQGACNVTQSQCIEVDEECYIRAAEDCR